jgi:hypothetical protein
VTILAVVPINRTLAAVEITRVIGWAVVVGGG